MKSLDKTVSVFATAVTIAALLLAGMILLPRLFGITPYIVKSGSMEPVIEAGAVAYFSSHDTDVEAGDIILFHLSDGSGGEMKVTHRMVREENGMIVTKGDANSIEDAALLDQEDVDGTFLFCIPKLGFFYAWMTRARCILLAVMILLLNVGAGLLHLIVYGE